jgi:hypothetical protein
MSPPLLEHWKNLLVVAAEQGMEKGVERGVAALTCWAMVHMCERAWALLRRLLGRRP